MIKLSNSQFMFKNNSETALNKWLPLSFLVLSAVGFTDALFLTFEHYEGLKVGCLIFNGCDKVTASAYATIGNIPVALFGAFYYLVILVLAATYLFLKNKNRGLARQTFDVMVRFTLVGFLASLWFAYLQFFVLQAICTYCMISALTSTALFALGTFALYRYKHI